MTKVFLCEWGDSEELAINSYDPKSEEVSEDFFSDDNGYEDDDINAIKNLELGEKYHDPMGNHQVTRIK